MSLDIYLHANPCPTCGYSEEEVYWANVTHNLGPMWEMAGVGNALYRSEGKLAGEIVDVLAAGFAAMSTDPDAYRALNPANGWGDFDSALAFLARLLAACRANPAARIHISA